MEWSTDAYHDVNQMGMLSYVEEAACLRRVLPDILLLDR